VFELHRRSRPRISVVAAARPNFMKVGPVVRGLRAAAEVDLVHTGQHYDDRMSRSFFDDLRLPPPDVNLEVGSGTHAEQTAAVLMSFERYLLQRDVDAVVVVGDVNSTVACALAAVKLHIPVAHVEAGLRSGDWRMPEEVNRVLTDRISRWLFTTSEDANRTLDAEGIPAEWTHLVGNVMIDTLYANLDRARDRTGALREEFDIRGRYGVLTLHRPSNVDEAGSLERLLGAITGAAGDLPFVFPVHPRTAAKLSDFGLRLPSTLKLVDPLGYLDFVGLVDGAEVVLTDSGGLQTETSALGVPCVTLRENTEWGITSELGTNRLVGTDPPKVMEGLAKALQSERQAASIPLWDGKSGQRVAEVLLEDLT
jgi:UDP-N-acetylglucosamine 2-epimerase (non-hydrolysing)